MNSFWTKEFYENFVGTNVAWCDGQPNMEVVFPFKVLHDCILNHWTAVAQQNVWRTHRQHP